MHPTLKGSHAAEGVRLYSGFQISGAFTAVARLAGSIMLSLRQEMTVNHEGRRRIREKKATRTKTGKNPEWNLCAQDSRGYPKT